MKRDEKHCSYVLWLDPELRRDFRILCAKRGVTVAQMIRQLMAEAVAQDEISSGTEKSAS